MPHTPSRQTILFIFNAARLQITQFLFSKANGDCEYIYIYILKMKVALGTFKYIYPANK